MTTYEHPGIALRKHFEKTGLGLIGIIHLTKLAPKTCMRLLCGDIEISREIAGRLNGVAGKDSQEWMDEQERYTSAMIRFQRLEDALMK